MVDQPNEKRTRIKLTSLPVEIIERIGLFCEFSNIVMLADQSKHLRDIFFRKEFGHSFLSLRARDTVVKVSVGTGVSIASRLICGTTRDGDVAFVLHLKPQYSDLFLIECDLAGQVETAHIQFLGEFSHCTLRCSLQSSSTKNCPICTLVRPARVQRAIDKQYRVFMNWEDKVTIKLKNRIRLNLVIHEEALVQWSDRIPLQFVSSFEHHQLLKDLKIDELPENVALLCEWRPIVNVFYCGLYQSQDYSHWIARCFRLHNSAKELNRS